MFETTETFLLFDYFRVPYRMVDNGVAGLCAPPHLSQACGQLGVEANDTASRALFWVRDRADQGALDSAVEGAFRLEGAPLFCRLIPDRVSADWLRETDHRWAPVTPIRDARGMHVASVWRDEHGSVFLPFDPAEAIQNYWSEAYQQSGRATLAGRLKRTAVWAYYRVRPALPRATQIRMRQLLSRVQARSRFPRWPIETGLHELYGFLFRQLVDLAGRPIPRLAEWPDGYSWALVLTHDVETETGYRHMHQLRDVEQEAGYRSCWNFVGRRYAVDDTVVKDLRDAGFEVGVHGLYHDGRDLESLARLNERLPAIRANAERWGATGFRSPATHRVWNWMPLLGFDYDSSYPDTDPFEPQSGGCCTWLPYFNHDLVELPITLPQDHTVFVILHQSDETAWVRKADFLKSRGGMALLITHPDYMLEQRLVRAYARFLQRYQSDQGVWKALPRDVSTWWRRRAGSHLKRTATGWEINGPATADGRIVYTTPT